MFNIFTVNQNVTEDTNDDKNYNSGDSLINSAVSYLNS